MLKVNVGLARKVGEAHYGSRGATVNLELELDSSLIGEPAKLKERIRQLFALVRTSLAEELNGGNGNGHSQPSSGEAPPSAANGNGNGNSNSNSHSPRSPNDQRSGGERPATPSQVKAIYAIARSLQINVVQFLRERFRVGRPDDLSLKDASAAIDELKNPDGSSG